MLVDLVKLPTLATLLGGAGMKLVDIGGRGEAFFGVLPLAAFSDYYVCEPDRQEAARLESQLSQQAPWRSVTVIAEAIASQRGTASLYVTEEPGMSSLLEPNPNVAKRFWLSAKFGVVSVATVPTLPLDEAAARYGFASACFLKLDTQGTELDVLRSGSQLIRESVLGVYVEGCLHPFYKGQSLFGDVDVHLRESGFSLFSIRRTGLRRAGYRTALYSRRVAAWVHALYLREPEALLALNTNALQLQVPRLLGLALAFHQFDLALEIVAMTCRLELGEGVDGDRLAEEVRRTCRDVTRHAIRKAKKTGSVDDLMSRSFRDGRFD